MLFRLGLNSESEREREGEGEVVTLLSSENYEL